MGNLKIVRTKIGNVKKRETFSDNEFGDYVAGDSKFDTRDFVYLENLAETNLVDRFATEFATDFVIANGCLIDYRLEIDNKYIASVLMRSTNLDNYIDVLSVNHGPQSRVLKNNPTCGLCPCLALDLESFLQNRTACSGYGTIEIPEFQYPQSRVDKETNIVLERLFQNGRLQKTGKSFTCSGYQGYKIPDVEEYVFNGKFYARVSAQERDLYIRRPDPTDLLWDLIVGKRDFRYSDGTEFKNNEEFWVNVEPIKWVIRNWENLPSSINPDGDGSAKTLDLISRNVIITNIPMCEACDNDSSKDLLWQNSIARAFLNGYDLHEEIKDNGNGNSEYMFEKNYSFKGKGFLNEMDHSKVLKMLNTKTPNEDIRQR